VGGGGGGGGIEDGIDDDDDDDDGHLGGRSVAFPIPVLLHMTTLTLTYVISAQNFPLKDTHKNIPTTTRTK